MYEYQMNTQLKYIQEELKRCAFEVLIGREYTVGKATSAIQRIKNFNVYETETGFRIETIVDDYKITVFHHNDRTKVEFFSEVNKDEQTEKERIQKLEKCVSDLHSEYTRLVRCNNRNATELYDLYNTIKSYGCGLSERLLEKEQKQNPS